MGNYDTRELVRKIEDRRGPLPFYLSRYFRTIMEFDTEEISFDYVFRSRRLAPFVSPLAEGKVMKRFGSNLKSFKPAYVKPKHILEPRAALKRLPGENFDGTLTPEQRRELLKAEIFMDQDEMIDNRLEWMACQILKSGSVTVEGEDYPTQNVDYGRDAGNSVTLVGAARWNDASPVPLQDIEDLSTAMSKAKHGGPAVDIIFDPDAWSDFRSNADVKDLLDKNFEGNKSSVDRGPLASADDVQVVGTIQGRFNLFIDSRDYEDEDGNTQPFLSSGEVLLASTRIEGAQGFGAILDDDVLHAMRAYPKEWKRQDPSATMCMTQSAPLPIPQRVNASAKIQTR